MRIKKRIIALALLGLPLCGCATLPAHTPDQAQLIRRIQLHGLCKGNHTCHDYKPPVGDPLVAYLIIPKNFLKYWI